MRTRNEDINKRTAKIMKSKEKFEDKKAKDKKYLKLETVVIIRGM